MISIYLVFAADSIKIVSTVALNFGSCLRNCWGLCKCITLHLQLFQHDFPLHILAFCSLCFSILSNYLPASIFLLCRHFICIWSWHPWLTICQTACLPNLFPLNHHLAELFDTFTRLPSPVGTIVRATYRFDCFQPSFWVGLDYSFSCWRE